MSFVKRWVAPLLLLGGCAAAPSVDDPTTGAVGDVPTVQGRRVASTELSIDHDTHIATALVRFEPGSDPTARLELAYPDAKVLGGTGSIKVGADAVLVEGMPAHDAWLSLTYALEQGDVLRVSFAKDRTSEATMTWPDNCGRLFPCHSSPDDASTFTLQIVKVDPRLTAVYPPSLPNVPAYQLAWAVGKYKYLSGGTTAAGTEIGYQMLTELADDNREGVTDTLARLREGFDWYERTYGAYRFGPRAGAVEVDTFPDRVGGMEHHPFWHVDSLDNVELQLHEAAHGWFGDGVRLRCWEDLVLSEGVATYVSMRAQVALGLTTEDSASAILAVLSNNERGRGSPAWPKGCSGTAGTFDARGMPHSEVYYRGAQFLREVARVTGADALDRALSDLYRARAGTSAGVADLLAQIEKSTGFDPRPLAEDWLRSATPPEAALSPRP